MGMLNDLKKLLFGAKSVAKSKGKQAAEAGKEAGEEFVERSKEFYGKTRERISDIKEEYGPKAREAADDARRFAEDIVDEAWSRGKEFGGKARKAADDFFEKKEPGEDEPENYKSNLMDDDELLFDDEKDSAGPETPEAEPRQYRKTRADEIGEKLFDAADKAGKKAQDISEKVGKEVLEKGGQAWLRFQEVSEKVGKRLMDTSEEVGGKLLDRFNELVEKANEEASKESVEDLTKEAEKLNEELERRIKERGERSNVENLQRDKSKEPLGGFDSFFDRASRYADGDYHDEGGKDMQIKKDPDYKPREKEGTVRGFEDRDGDGDEIIDDAIIDEDDK